MNPKLLMHYISECVGRYTFTFDSLYEKLQHKPSAPTADELRYIIVKGLENNTFVRCTTKKDEPWKFKIVCEKSISVPEMVEKIRSTCLKEEDYTVPINVIFQELKDGQSSRARNVISVLASLKILEHDTSFHPAKIKWNPENDNFYRNTEALAQDLETLAHYQNLRKDLQEEYARLLKEPPN